MGEWARLRKLRKAIQRRSKSVNITHLDVLVTRKACIAAKHMDIGAGGADK